MTTTTFITIAITENTDPEKGETRIVAEFPAHEITSLEHKVIAARAIIAGLPEKYQEEARKILPLEREPLFDR